MGIVRRRKVDVAKDLPDKRIADIPVELDDDFGRSIRAAERELGPAAARRATAGSSPPARRSRATARTACSPSRPRPPWRSTRTSCDGYACRSSSRRAPGREGPENVFTHGPPDRPGQGACSRRTTPRSCRARWARSSSSPSTSTSWTPPSGSSPRPACGRSRSAATRPRTQRQQAIDAFQKDPDVAVAVCSLTAAGVGLNLHAASNVVLAELSWTAAEQQQAIDRVHRIGQDEPVTAWRILAAQHDRHARSPSSSTPSRGSPRARSTAATRRSRSGDSVQLDALIHLLRQALTGR